MSPLLRWTSTACLMLTLCGVQTTALAQDDLPDPETIEAAPVTAEAPIRIGLVDLTKKRSDSDRIRESLTEKLEAEERLSLIGRRDLIQGFVDEKLSRDVLRSGDGRSASQDAIARIMESKNLEVLIMMDAYGKGRNLQLIVFSRAGVEVKELKFKLEKRKRVNSSEREESLEMILEEGESIAMSSREEEAAKERARVEAAIAEREQKTEMIDDEQDEPVAIEPSKEASSGATKTRARVGVLLGERDFLLENSSFAIDQEMPMAGAAGGVKVSKPVANGKVLLGGSAALGWAPVRILDLDNDEEVILKGNFVNVSPRFEVDVPLGAIFALGVDLGADVTSITLEPNALYTGHRYIFARGGLDALITPLDKLHVRLGAAALPVLQTLTSGGAYGDAEGGLGIEFGGEAGFRFSDKIGLALDFRQLSFAQTYGEESLSESLTSSDLTRQGSVGIFIDL